MTLTLELQQKVAGRDSFLIYTQSPEGRPSPASPVFHICFHILTIPSPLPSLMPIPYSLIPFLTSPPFFVIGPTEGFC